MANELNGVTSDWKKRFRALEQTCPWPGPRPLENTDPRRLLVGRDDDIRSFRREVDSHRLILLTGDSGVGKTSLLERGLVPELVDVGFSTVICRDWSGSWSSDDPAGYLGSKIKHEFSRLGVSDLRDGGYVFRDLEKRFGANTVIVLDQFEELIRYSPSLTEGMFRLLLDLNSETNLKLVISFRNEYLHRLRRIEKSARPFTLSVVYLEEINEDFIGDVVRSANSQAVPVITEGTVKRVEDLWRDARTRKVGELDTATSGRIGLLHLQALLYALHAQSEGGEIDERVFDDFQADSPDSTGLFARALEVALTVKMRRCKSAALECGLDHCLVDGTMDTISRSVRHLSSAGYKLVREAWDLAKVTLDPDLDMLIRALPMSKSADETEDGPLGVSQLDALFKTVIAPVSATESQLSFDPLTAGRDLIAAAADGGTSMNEPAVSWTARLHPGEVPMLADPLDTSGGMMLGQSPAAVLIESLRRYVFALLCLSESSLVRISTPGGNVMVSLIHDGFGAALLNWSTRANEVVGPAGVLAGITATRAEDIEWRPGPDGRNWPELTGGDDPVVLLNLRWRGWRVHAEFVRVVFVNCDLRGTYFDDCRFEGTTFINCLLDGVIFSDCQIEGSFKPATGEVTGANPQFLVPTNRAPSLPQVLATYQGLNNPSNVLKSNIAGLPASPAPLGEIELLDWVAEPGGVIIYGGRISSFMVRACTYGSGGGFSFRRVAGSGCDLVDQAAGILEFFSCALRHITVTTPRWVDEEDFTITANGSMLADVWIGENLSGTFEVDNCTLIHMWNSSPELKASATNSRLLGLVNVHSDQTCGFATGSDDTVWIEGTALALEIADVTRLMDYQRRPYLIDELAPDNES